MQRDLELALRSDDVHVTVPRPPPRSPPAVDEPERNSTAPVGARRHGVALLVWVFLAPTFIGLGAVHRSFRSSPRSCWPSSAGTSSPLPSSSVSTTSSISPRIPRSGCRSCNTIVFVIAAVIVQLAVALALALACAVEDAQLAAVRFPLVALLPADPVRRIRLAGDVLPVQPGVRPRQLVPRAGSVSRPSAG